MGSKQLLLHHCSTCQEAKMLLNTVVSSSDNSYNTENKMFTPCPASLLRLALKGGFFWKAIQGWHLLKSYQAEQAERVSCSHLLYIGSDFRNSVSKHRRAQRPWLGPRALAALHPSSPLAREQFSPSAPGSPSPLTSPTTILALQRKMFPKALHSLPDPGA